MDHEKTCLRFYPFFSPSLSYTVHILWGFFGDTSVRCSWVKCIHLDVPVTDRFCLGCLSWKHASSVRCSWVKCKYWDGLVTGRFWLGCLLWKYVTSVSCSWVKYRYLDVLVADRFWLGCLLWKCVTSVGCSWVKCKYILRRACYRPFLTWLRVDCVVVKRAECAVRPEVTLCRWWDVRIQEPAL